MMFDKEYSLKFINTLQCSLPEQFKRKKIQNLLSCNCVINAGTTI